MLRLLIVDVLMMADCKNSLVLRSSDDPESCQDRDSTFNLSLATEDMFLSRDKKAGEAVLKFMP